MLILEARNIKKYYGDRLIISIADLKVQKGDKIGIVGQNGAGKTTFLNILAGEMEPDEGIVNRYCDIAYIRQFSDDDFGTEGKVFKEFGVRSKSNCGSLSGGELSRLRIAGELSKENMMLFADEPTSNLDYKGIVLLKEKLAQAETLLLVSHDRDLMNRLCNKIIEVKDGKLSVYEGNFSSYQEQKGLELERKRFEYEQYISKKESLERAARDREMRANSMTKAPKRMGNSEARLHKGKIKEKRKKMDSAANVIKKRIEKLDVKEKPREQRELKLNFALTTPPENKIIISCQDLSFSYGSNKIFEKANFRIKNGTKTAIIGDNGAGKTTLMNLINDRDKCINIVPKAVLGYFYQNFGNLNYNRSILENVMKDSIQNETTVRTILARMLIAGDDVYKNVSVASGGEKIKVSLAKLLVSDANVLMLDEPTNYLDMQSIEALESMLCEYEGTILLVSHDRAFINNIADRLLILDDRKIVEFDGNLEAYEDSKHKINGINNIEMQETVLKMRMTEILSKLSLPNCQKDALEAEYQSILEKLKCYRNKNRR